MTSRYRKVFIDSRWRISGTHNTFQIELPRDIETTATSTVYVASCSFSTAFDTITSADDRLYCLAARVNNGVVGAPTPIVVTIARGKYTGATFAAELQTRLRDAILDGSYSVTFDAAYGRLTFSSTLNRVQFPSDGELRSASWKADNWDPYTSIPIPLDPLDTNAIIYFPRPSSLQQTTVAGPIDLTALREVFLHSSLSGFQTLKSGTGETDCLIRLPIDTDYGTVITWKHLGSSDAIAVPNQRLRTLWFSFRDWAGREAGISQPVSIELTFLDTDMYNL